VTGRGDPVDRPRPWTFEFGDRQAASGRDKLVRHAPSAADDAWVAIASDPTATSQRQHHLKGQLAHGSFQGRSLPQWQFKATGSGRVWYLVDVENRTLVMTQAGTGHPKSTDKKVRRGRH